MSNPHTRLLAKQSWSYSRGWTVCQPRFTNLFVRTIVFFSKKISV